MQLWKLKAKNEFLTWLKTWDLRAIGLSFLRDQTVEREKGEEKREEEKEEEKKKIKGRSSRKAKLRYGTTWAFKALNGFPCNCMVISCL